MKAIKCRGFMKAIKAIKCRGFMKAIKCRGFRFYESNKM